MSYLAALIAILVTSAAIIYLKRRPTLLLAVVLIIVTGIVGLVGLLAWPYTPIFKDYLRDTSMFKGSRLIYQLRLPNVYSLAPGNDSYVMNIKQLATTADVELLLSQQQPFENCQKTKYKCFHNPTWRPRIDLIQPNSTHFDEAELENNPAVYMAYRQLATAADTKCAARGFTDFIYKPDAPNWIVVCASPALRYVSIGYISIHDVAGT